MAQMKGEDMPEKKLSVGLSLLGYVIGLLIGMVIVCTIWLKLDKMDANEERLKELEDRIKVLELVTFK